MTVSPELAEWHIGRHSKSFAMAAKLLPKRAGEDAIVLYAWCRRADDAIDDAPPETQPEQLRQLRKELAETFEGRPPKDAVVRAFAEVVERQDIPFNEPAALLDGMAMDVEDYHYGTRFELLEYCYRVASTVGLMMCRVMGVKSPAALAHAAHLGIAMQLTNIARDVNEDWQRSRLYIPEELLTAHGVERMDPHSEEPLNQRSADALRPVVAELLAMAEEYYASGRAGLRYLSLRNAIAVAAAAAIYRAIGTRIAAQNHNVLAPRAYVGTAAKLLLVGGALFSVIVQRITSRGEAKRNAQHAAANGLWLPTALRQELGHDSSLAAL